MPGRAKLKNPMLALRETYRQTDRQTDKQAYRGKMQHMFRIRNEKKIYTNRFV